jgi:3-oxo-5-alpha-steroid 4-dehydrogenase 1
MTFNSFVIGWTVFAVLFIPVLLKITAPYGRHSREGWGIMINNTLGWIIMELTSPICFAIAFFYSGVEKSPLNYFFMALWMLHYLNRSIIYPLRYPNKNKQMPVSIALNAIFFNLINGSINGYFLGSIQPQYAADYLLQWNFIVGIILFFSGFIINIQSDNILLRLRKPGESVYKIPTGGLYRFISSPNYFGEIIEWTGFAIACWSLPALSFAVWTFSNLAPRAIANHQWYRKKFSDYPKERKALIPFCV